MQIDWVVVDAPTPTLSWREREPKGDGVGGDARGPIVTRMMGEGVPSSMTGKNACPTEERHLAILAERYPRTLSTTACTAAIFASAVARSGASAMMRMIGSVLLGRAWTQALGQSMRMPSCVSTFSDAKDCFSASTARLASSRRHSNLVFTIS